MLHIIGVSHFVQARKPNVEKTEDQKTFTSLLKQTIQHVHPDFVGEENSEVNLSERQEISIAKEISDELRIEHRFCDPDDAERKTIGYESGTVIYQVLTTTGDIALPLEELRLMAYAIAMARYFPIRERFWLDRLNGCQEHDAIFVCGYGHLESFSLMLENERIAYRIVVPDLGITTEERKDVQGTIRYLREHPELKTWHHRLFPYAPSK
jgi:hypothetical protein